MNAPRASEATNMYYIVESKKSFEDAVRDLDAAVSRHQFGVLHVHDLGATLRSKGFAFAGQCKVFEVCSPRHAASVLATDLRLNMALPCRISVYTENGSTRIGMIRPVPMLGMLSQDASLAAIAQEVESATMRMIDEAA
ncbi:DUF302 domain-containing protein [Rhodanobacter thiooxydans]|nr:DUF302 domain-containing protein [Rhodanobacter thiooxydans]EIL97984.1 hypothetical protein UUA_13145 [Rhodanobacter thiooxydans LCS2]MCW0202417.1 DUF302 domain-containing protein [Rhodanobacter thiooxydans]